MGWEVGGVGCDGVGGDGGARYIENPWNGIIPLGGYTAVCSSSPTIGEGWGLLWGRAVG